MDWGGVLTTGLQSTMTAWCESDGVDYEQFRAVLRDWLGPSYGRDVEVSPVHALERGEMEVPDFERRLAARLRTHDGRQVDPEGLLNRMFAGFRTVHTMHDVVRRAKEAGLRTCLLSNSWGNSYPREGWDEMFDAVVVSGEVGMRKPEPRIYYYAAERIGLPPRACVFVDDLRSNVRGAAEVGMVGVHHETPERTIDELESILDLPLR